MATSNDQRAEGALWGLSRNKFIDVSRFDPEENAQRVAAGGLWRVTASQLPAVQDVVQDDVTHLPRMSKRKLAGALRSVARSVVGISGKEKRRPSGGSPRSHEGGRRGHGSLAISRNSSFGPGALHVDTKSLPMRKSVSSVAQMSVNVVGITKEQDRHGAAGSVANMMGGGAQAGSSVVGNVNANVVGGMSMGSVLGMGGGGGGGGGGASVAGGIGAGGGVSGAGSSGSANTAGANGDTTTNDDGISLDVVHSAARQAIVALRTPYDCLEDEVFAPVEYYLMLCREFGIYLNPGLMFVPRGTALEPGPANPAVTDSMEDHDASVESPAELVEALLRGASDVEGAGYVSDHGGGQIPPHLMGGMAPRSPPRAGNPSLAAGFGAATGGSSARGPRVSVSGRASGAAGLTGSTAFGASSSNRMLNSAGGPSSNQVGGGGGQNAGNTSYRRGNSTYSVGNAQQAKVQQHAAERTTPDFMGGEEARCIGTIYSASVAASLVPYSSCVSHSITDVREYRLLVGLVASHYQVAAAAVNLSSLAGERDRYEDEKVMLQSSSMMSRSFLGRRTSLDRKDIMGLNLTAEPGVNPMTSVTMQMPMPVTGDLPVARDGGLRNIASRSIARSIELLTFAESGVDGSDVVGMTAAGRRKEMMLLGETVTTDMLAPIEHAPGGQGHGRDEDGMGAGAGGSMSGNVGLHSGGGGLGGSPGTGVSSMSPGTTGVGGVSAGGAAVGSTSLHVASGNQMAGPSSGLGGNVTVGQSGAGGPPNGGPMPDSGIMDKDVVDGNKRAVSANMARSIITGSEEMTKAQKSAVDRWLVIDVHVRDSVIDVGTLCLIRMLYTVFPNRLGALHFTNIDFGYIPDLKTWQRLEAQWSCAFFERKRREASTDVTLSATKPPPLKKTHSVATLDRTMSGGTGNTSPRGGNTAQDGNNVTGSHSGCDEQGDNSVGSGEGASGDAGWTFWSTNAIPAGSALLVAKAQKNEEQVAYLQQEIQQLEAQTLGGQQGHHQHHQHHQPSQGRLGLGGGNSYSQLQTTMPTLTPSHVPTGLLQLDYTESEVWLPCHDRDMGVLHNLPRCIRLAGIKSLVIERCGAFGSALTHALVCGGRRCSGLESLSIRSCGIGDVHAEALAAGLPQNPFLSVLNLHNNQIGNQGAATLARSLVAPGSVNSLHGLDLTRNAIGDEGCAALAAIVRYQTVPFADLVEAKKRAVATSAMFDAPGQGAVLNEPRQESSGGNPSTRGGGRRRHRQRGVVGGSGGGSGGGGAGSGGTGGNQGGGAGLGPGGAQAGGVGAAGGPSPGGVAGAAGSAGPGLNVGVGPGGSLVASMSPGPGGFGSLTTAASASASGVFMHSFVSMPDGSSTVSETVMGILGSKFTGGALVDPLTAFTARIRNAASFGLHPVGVCGPAVGDSGECYGRLSSILRGMVDSVMYNTSTRPPTSRARRARSPSVTLGPTPGVGALAQSVMLAQAWQQQQQSSAQLPPPMQQQQQQQQQQQMAGQQMAGQQASVPQQPQQVMAQQQPGMPGMPGGLGPSGAGGLMTGLQMGAGPSSIQIGGPGGPRYDCEKELSARGRERLTEAMTNVGMGYTAWLAVKGAQALVLQHAVDGEDGTRALSSTLSPPGATGPAGMGNGGVMGNLGAQTGAPSVGGSSTGQGPSGNALPDLGAAGATGQGNPVGGLASTSGGLNSEPLGAGSGGMVNIDAQCADVIAEGIAKVFGPIVPAGSGSLVGHGLGSGPAAAVATNILTALCVLLETLSEGRDDGQGNGEGGYYGAAPQHGAQGLGATSTLLNPSMGQTSGSTASHYGYARPQGAGQSALPPVPTQQHQQHHQQQSQLQGQQQSIDQEYLSAMQATQRRDQRLQQATAMIRWFDGDCPSYQRSRSYFGENPDEIAGQILALGQVFEGCIIASSVNVRTLRVFESIAHISALPATCVVPRMRRIPGSVVALHNSLACGAAVEASRRVIEATLRQQKLQNAVQSYDAAGAPHIAVTVPGAATAGCAANPGLGSSGAGMVPGGPNPSANGLGMRGYDSSATAGWISTAEVGNVPPGALANAHQASTVMGPAAVGVLGANALGNVPGAPGVHDDGRSVVFGTHGGSPGGGAEGQLSMPSLESDLNVERKLVASLGGLSGILSVAGVDPQWVVEWSVEGVFAAIRGRSIGCFIQAVGG